MKKILITFIFILPLIINADKKVADIFSPEYRNQLFMDVEVALAEAQAELGIIPEWAANEIKSKANLKYLNQDDIDAEHKLVRHTLVARLNVWKRSIDNDTVEKFITKISNSLEEIGQNEISSNTIGTMVMDGLKNLDPVAYVRFASVYRNFREEKDFVQFVDKIDVFKKR